MCFTQASPSPYLYGPKATICCWEREAYVAGYVGHSIPNAVATAAVLFYSFFLKESWMCLNIKVGHFSVHLLWSLSIENTPNPIKLAGPFDVCKVVVHWGNWTVSLKSDSYNDICRTFPTVLISWISLLAVWFCSPAYPGFVFNCSQHISTIETSLASPGWSWGENWKCRETCGLR